jgi:hypothetical protein
MNYIYNNIYILPILSKYPTYWVLGNPCRFNAANLVKLDGLLLEVPNPGHSNGYRYGFV